MNICIYICIHVVLGLTAVSEAFEIWKVLFIVPEHLKSDASRADNIDWRVSNVPRAPIDWILQPY